MDNIVDLIKVFIKNRRAILFLAFVNYVIIFILCYLYSVNFEVAVYFMFLSFAVIVAVAIYKFIHFFDKHDKLTKFLNNCVIEDLKFIEGNSLIEDDYKRIVVKYNSMLEHVVTNKDYEYSEMIDYFTLWTHQIKTPIAAINILMQTKEFSNEKDVTEQLFKIEQYVDMALQYLRMGSMSNDLLIQSCNLDSIVKKAIKKFSKLFIRKRITLDYQKIDCTVLTDEKWLQFVIEQVISNALKYTKTGKISIYMDEKLTKTLIIEDTGIGIEPEDLPRVFEKGFTGYNGRENKKSTGIGLFLCKQVLSKLSHKICIESELGIGTKVKIGLETLNMFHE